MFKSTFHAHSRYDDGEGELEDYIRSAVVKKFKVFGFSAHAPVLFDTTWNMKLQDFDDYIETTKLLKERYRGSLEIYTGLEADYYPGCVDWRNKEGVDYTIGAVHFLKNEETGQYMPMDGDRKEFEDALEQGFDGKIELLVQAYYCQIREMLLKMTPNVVAHLDVIRKNNAGKRFFDENEDWYRDEVMKTLEIVSLTNTIVEVNTGGLARKYVKEPYPSIWILEQCHELDIPVMVNSDAHNPSTIDYYFNETHNMLKFIGFKNQRILYGDKWRDVGL